MKSIEPSQAIEQALREAPQVDLSWIEPPPTADGWTLAPDALRFVRGWYDEESSGPNAFRWMGLSSSTELPPISGRGALTLQEFRDQFYQKKNFVFIAH